MRCCVARFSRWSGAQEVHRSHVVELGDQEVHRSHVVELGDQGGIEPEDGLLTPLDCRNQKTLAWAYRFAG